MIEVGWRRCQSSINPHLDFPVRIIPSFLSLTRYSLYKRCYLIFNLLLSFTFTALPMPLLTPLARLALSRSQARSLVPTVSIARMFPSLIFPATEKILTCFLKKGFCDQWCTSRPIDRRQQGGISTAPFTFQRKAEGSHFRVIRFRWMWLTTFRTRTWYWEQLLYASTLYHVQSHWHI